MMGEVARQIPLGEAAGDSAWEAGRPQLSLVRKVEVDRSRDALLTASACRLADLGARLHPDHRIELVFDQVLRAPIAGMNHAERAFLASAAKSARSAARRKAASTSTVQPSASSMRARDSSEA